MSDIALLNPAEHNYEPGLSVLHHNTVSQVGALIVEFRGCGALRNTERFLSSHFYISL
jgi:hypothetical protein